MRDFPTLSTARRSRGAEATLAKPLAPEDVRKGDFVGVLYVIYELPSFFWCAESFQIPHDEPVRLQLVPEPGPPLKVQSVCVPFVFVKDPVGKQKMLDLRKCRLARLDRDFARTIWKAHKKQRAKQAAPGLATDLGLDL